MMKPTFFTIVLLTTGFSLDATAAEPAWVGAMKRVHRDFRGDPGYVAQLGDSITYSMAFWSAFGWSDPTKHLPDDALPKNPPKAKLWKRALKGFRDKGGEHGNYSGWRIGNLLKVVDKVLTKKKPEAAIIMIGTNDVRGNKAPSNYEPGLNTVIEKCLAAHCVPILSTIPPMRGREKGVAEANAIIKKLAAKHKLPLIEFHRAVLERRATDWDGTLIGKDGVHPSGGKNNDFSAANLKTSGYALRNWVSFLKLREVYFKVLRAK
jgi:lysophospholipase L1-like esterase